MTKGGKKYSQLTMYDFRHSGACHWRTGAYKTKIDALMYRGGWNNLTRLNSELNNSEISLVGISNDLVFADNLDPRVKSSLSEEEIEDLFKRFKKCCHANHCLV